MNTAAGDAVLSHWGPALMVCFTVIIGLFYQNSRINDLNRRIDDLREALGQRIGDLKDSLGQRIERLESPLSKR